MTACSRFAVLLSALLVAGPWGASAAVLIEFPMHSLFDFSPMVYDTSISGTIYPSNVEGWVDDDGFGNVLQAYPMPGATTYNTALSTPSYFDIVLMFGNGSDLDSMDFEVGKGGSSDPRGYVVRSSVDSFTTDLRAEELPSGAPEAPSLRTIDLSGEAFQGQSALTFRFYVYTPNPPGYYSVDWRNFRFSDSAPDALPETGSWCLLASGLGALVVLKRRHGPGNG